MYVTCTCTCTLHVCMWMCIHVMINRYPFTDSASMYTSLHTCTYMHVAFDLHGACNMNDTLEHTHKVTFNSHSP